MAVRGAAVRPRSRTGRCARCRSARAREAAADLEALRRGQRHHRLREIGLELVEDRLAEPGGHAARDALDDAAERVAARGALRRCARSSRAAAAASGQRTVFGLDRGERDASRRRPSASIVVHALHPGEDLDAAPRRAAACARSRRRRRGRSSRAPGAPAALPVADAVLGLVGVVGVRGPVDVLHVLVGLGPRVLVAHQDARSACRASGPRRRPERISARSASSRGVVSALWPGRRRSRSRWISSTRSRRRGGQPSMTTPTPPPWVSPKVVIRNGVRSGCSYGWRR